MQESSTKKIYDIQSVFYDATFGRLVKRRIERAITHMNIKDTDRVLDLGIGTGASLNFYPNRGQIVGDYGDAGGKSHGFVLDRGTFTTIDVPGATVTLAQGINEPGQIVGVYIDDPVNFVWHSYLVTGATFTKIDVPGSTGTGAFGINLAGQIVGKYFTADGLTHGFLAEPVPKGKPQ